MAKRIETVAHKANFAGYDGKQLLTDVDRIEAKNGKLKEAAGPMKEDLKKLKHDRGYHMGGFSVLRRLRRMEPTDAQDMARTIIAGIEAAGFLDPDLVDRAEA